MKFHISIKRGLLLLYNSGSEDIPISAKTFTSDAVVRLNTPRNILLSLSNIPYGTLDIPESFNSAHSILPMYSSSGSITFKVFRYGKSNLCIPRRYIRYKSF